MKEYGLALSKAIGSADAELINLVLLDAKAELPSAEFFEMLLPHPQATPRPDMLSFGCGASSPSPLAAHSGFVCGVCVRSLVRVSSVSSLVFRQSAHSVSSVSSLCSVSQLARVPSVSSSGFCPSARSCFVSQLVRISLVGSPHLEAARSAGAAAAHRVLRGT